MDQNSNKIQSKNIQALEKLLVETILNSYEKKEIDYSNMKKSAGFILDNIDKVQSQDDLKKFLTDLSFYWPIFKDVLVIQTQKNDKVREQEIISKLSSYIKNYKSQ